MCVCPLRLALLQESGTERAGIRGGPDEDLGRGFATQAAAHRGGCAALEGETGTLYSAEGTVWHRVVAEGSHQGFPRKVFFF